MSFAEFARTTGPLTHHMRTKRPGVFKPGDRVYYVQMYDGREIHGTVVRVDTKYHPDGCVWCYWERTPGRPFSELGWMGPSDVRHA